MNSIKGMVVVVIALLLTACGQSGPPEPDYTGFRPLGDNAVMQDSTQWGELNVHDPAVIKAGDWYYAYSTDASLGDIHKRGIQIRRSRDLITWQYLGTAFEDYASECGEIIAHAGMDTEAGDGFWAPDVEEIDGVYRMYFSASTFGSSRSAIGLAEAKKPEGPFAYKGIVVRSEAGASIMPNAIDPAVVTDKDGKRYLSYGSFFGGIFIALLDDATGFFAEGTEPVRIAGNRGCAVEASAITYLPETGFYYLFVSYGSLSGNYNIRVGRSESVTGPYLDPAGRDMREMGAGGEDKVGAKLLGGYTFLSDPGPPPTKGYMAPGHEDVLVDGENYFLIHHVRTYKLPDYWFSMNVRRFALNSDGWPVVAPNRYQGEALTDCTLPDGEYALVEHGTDSNSESHDSVRITAADGQITGAHAGSYTCYDGWRIRITLDGVEYDGFVQEQYDWERNSPVTAFSAMSADGRSIWGCTQL